MNTRHLILICFFFLSLCACQETPSVDQLTYQEMWSAVFGQSDGERIEWHGEAIDQTAIADLSFEESGNCGEGDCGQIIFVKNNSERVIEAVIQSSFSLPEFPPYTAVKLTIPANGKAKMGCNHLCIGDQQFRFSPKAVGAIYVDP